MYGWIQVGEKNDCVFIGWLLWGWERKRKEEKKWKEKKEKIEKRFEKEKQKEFEIMLC